MTAITLAASAARTATANGSTVDLGVPLPALVLRLSVSIVSVTTSPVLTVTVQHSDDNTFFRSAYSFPSPISTTGVQDVSLSGLDRYVRAAWTIGGASASFTFALVGNSQVAYALPADMATYAAPSPAFGTITITEKTEALISATSFVNSYLQARYTLPIAGWGKDIRRATAILASYDLLLARGLFRDESQQKNLQLQRDQVVKWLEQIRDGLATPDGLVDNTPTVTNGSSILYTRTKRGWGTR